jgi:hypothetical protein
MKFRKIFKNYQIFIGFKKTKIIFKFILFLFLIALKLYSHTEKYPFGNRERALSYPYISGDDFRSIANHVYDDTNQFFDPKAVQKGDIVFVAGEEPNGFDPQMRYRFFTEIHPYIENSYILITHNADLSSPGPYINILEDPKIFLWFAENPDISDHPKLIPIPIGLRNNHYGRQLPYILSELEKHPEKKRCNGWYVYGNFSIYTNPEKRQPVFDLFKSKKFVYFPKKEKTQLEYLKDISKARFVLSPHGNGLDCYRTWEALILGSIPIVKTSSLDSLYTDLPVIIVKDWPEVTEFFLKQKFNEFSLKTYKREKLYFDYWKNLILNAQFTCKNSYEKK